MSSPAARFGPGRKWSPPEMTARCRPTIGRTTLGSRDEWLRRAHRDTGQAVTGRSRPGTNRCWLRLAAGAGAPGATPRPGPARADRRSCTPPARASRRSADATRPAGPARCRATRADRAPSSAGRPPCAASTPAPGPGERPDPHRTALRARRARAVIVPPACLRPPVQSATTVEHPFDSAAPPACRAVVTPPAPRISLRPFSVTDPSPNVTGSRRRTCPRSYRPEGLICAHTSW